MSIQIAERSVHNLCMNEIDRIDKLLSKLALKWADLAKELKVSDQVVTNWKKRGSIPKSRLTAVSNFLKVSVDYIVTGEDALWESAKEFYTRQGLITDSKVREDSGVYAWESPGDLDPEHYAFVPRYDVHVSAGNGSVVYEAQEKERPQSFRLEYLQQKGLKEENLMCLTAAGDSMEPTITDGANLLVNRGETTVQDGKVYVIRFGSDIRVKRIYLRPDSGMTVHSDNPSFPDVDVTPDQMEHVAIIGRVVWQAGDL